MAARSASGVAEPVSPAALRISAPSGPSGESAASTSARADHTLGGHDVAVADAVALVRVQTDFYDGRYESTVQRALEVMGRWTSAEPGWSVVATLAAMAMGRSRQTARLDVIESALASADPATTHPAADRPRASLAMEFYLGGQIARGDAQLAAISRSPEALAETDPSAGSMLFVARATRFAAMGRLFSHVRESLRALDVAIPTGDRFLVAACYGSSANTLSLLGQDERCERLLADAMAYCAHGGTSPQTARLLLARATLALAAGRYREALADGRKAQAILAAASEERRLAQAHHVIVRALLELGETDEAGRTLRSLAAQDAALPALRAVHALLRLREGEPGAALAEAREVQASLDGHNLIYRCFTALTAHDAAVALGDRATAHAVLREARAAYDLIADDAPDDDARRGLARNVVDHARLLSLAP